MFFIYPQYADPTDEPSSQVYDQTFEDYELSIQDWKGEDLNGAIWEVKVLFFRQNLEWNQKFQQHAEQSQPLWVVVSVEIVSLQRTIWQQMPLKY